MIGWRAPQAALHRALLKGRARAVLASPRNRRPSPPIWLGQTWAEVETVSPALRRRPIAMTALREAIAEAEPILHRLRQSAAAAQAASNTDDMQSLAL